MIIHALCNYTDWYKNHDNTYLQCRKPFFLYDLKILFSFGFFLQLLFMKCDILQILPVFVCFMCQIWILCRPGNWHYAMAADSIKPCSLMYLFSGIHIIKLSLNSWFEDEKIKIIAFKFCLWEKKFVLIKSRCCTLLKEKTCMHFSVCFSERGGG